MIVSFSERATVRFLNHTSGIEQHAYKHILLFYYIGTFIGRSSLSFFTLDIPKIKLVTFLQFINTVIFFTVAKYEWMGMSMMMLVMIWIGILGGLSYANCFYQIINTDRVSKEFKELALNFGGILLDSGILIVSVLGVVFAHTILAKDQILVQL